MPITPDEAARDRESGSASYDDATRRIDLMLSTVQPNYLGEWWFPLEGVPIDVFERIKNIYANYDWSVEVRKQFTFTLDQRTAEGFYLVFKARK